MNSDVRKLMHPLVGGLTALSLLFAVACGGHSMDKLRDLLADRIGQTDADVVGVHFYDLVTGDSLEIEADTVLHAASMMKVLVMIQAFRDVDANMLSLDAETPITNTFHSVIDGSPFQLAAGDDSDGSLYARLGETARMNELVDLMITVSSNLATNILIDHLGAERIQTLAREFEVPSMEMVRGVEDLKAYEAGISNRTTARDMGKLFRLIFEGKAASRTSCDNMLAILAGQRFNDGIPAGLPIGTDVAHKTGRITRINHDGGIVSDREGRRYVLVVLTSGIDDPAVSDKLIADLSRIVYTAIE
jgi:beta-lactamase class A